MSARLLYNNLNGASAACYGLMVVRRIPYATVADVQWGSYTTAIAPADGATINHWSKNAASVDGGTITGFIPAERIRNIPDEWYDAPIDIILGIYGEALSEINAGDIWIEVSNPASALI
jgi:hypothetical protein